ncbi:hypothetical protein DL771_009049 [Monosporascus sp. 5C6A]|nr:hypothetical protein DL771_009049 [Monosporascus sp. 5C6A]
MVDVFGTNSSARLEGLVAANAFLDTFVLETSSGAYSDLEIPRYKAPLVSPQQRSSDTPIPVLPWRSSPYSQQPAYYERWDLLLELRNKTDGHYKAVKEYLGQNYCVALPDWLDGYPTPSHMREVGLRALRDIDQDKPPASIGDSFAAALVQYSVFEIRLKTDYTASSSALTEWGHILFSEVVWEQLSPVCEYLSSGYTSNNSPNVWKSPKPSSMSDPSEHLGSGAQFDGIGLPAASQLSFSTFGTTSYDTLSLSMDPAYPEQMSGRDHGLMPLFHETPHFNTPIPNFPLLTLSPAALNFPPLMASGAQVELPQQMFFDPALSDIVNNTRGPAGLEDAHSDRLCYQLKNSRSWATIMAYLDSFGTQNNLLDRFPIPSTDRPDPNYFDPTVTLDRLPPRQPRWNTLPVPSIQGPSTSTSISYESDVSLTDPDEVASQDIGTATSYDGESISISCPYCDKVYTGNSAPTSFLRHKRTKHGDGDMYGCPYCPKSQARSDNLRVHIKGQHPGKKVPKGKAAFKALMIDANQKHSYT